MAGQFGIRDGGAMWLRKMWGNIANNSVSQLPGRGPVSGPGINDTGPREVLLEFVTLVF